MHRLSAHEVRDTIIDRMVNNLYPIGAKLPTARELASELGVHRNTVSKAYNFLAELGLVVSKPGRGTHVVAVVDQNCQPGLSQILRTDIAGVIMAARRLGIGEDDLRQILDTAIGDVYQHPSRQGVFIECNQSDLTGGINEIETITQIRVDGLLLDDVRSDPSSVVEKYTVAFTNLIHVKEVSDLLDARASSFRIVGVYTQPDENALVEIAKIKPGSSVGIVVDSAEGARRFINQITTFNPVDVKVVLSRDDTDIEEALQNVDAIVCSRSREGQIQRLNLGAKVITLSLHISRQSALRVLDAMLTNGTAKDNGQPGNRPDRDLSPYHLQASNASSLENVSST